MMNKQKEIKFCFLCRSSNENIKKCKDCRNSICDKCVINQKAMLFVIKKHTNCLECNKQICCYKTICEKCDINPYHMISDKIGVGSCASDYKEFDIIINLNYPENGVKENDIEFQKKEGKLIMKIGLSDNISKEKEAYKYITEIIPILNKYYSDKKILFHCYSGISRSPCFAIAYLLYIEKIGIDDAYSLIKSKRKFIKINEGFMRALSYFEKFINS